MPSRQEDLKYPIRGISETYGFSYAEELTSRDEQNMRSIDPTNGRIRGAQRAGLGLYAGDGMAVTDKKIKALGVTHTNKVQLDYAQDLTPATTAGNSPYKFTPASPCADLTQDEYGTYYALTETGHVTVFNEELGVVNEFDMPEEALDPSTDPLGGTGASDTEQQPPVASCIAVDQYLNIYIGTGAASATVPKWCAVYCFALLEDDTYELAWTRPMNAYVLDLKFYKSDLYVLASTASSSNSGELECISANMTYTTGGGTHKLTLNESVDYALMPEVGDKVYLQSDQLANGTSAAVIAAAGNNSAYLKFSSELAGATTAADTWTVKAWPQYLDLHVRRFAGTSPSTIGGDFDEPVVSGEPQITFAVDASSLGHRITYSGPGDAWPGMQPRAGDTITVSNAHASANNGNFTVKHATPTELVVVETVAAETPGDHFVVSWNGGPGGPKIPPGMTRREWFQKKGWDQNYGDSVSFVVSDKTCPVITIKNPGFRKRFTTGMLNLQQQSGRMDISDEGEMYVTWAAFDTTASPFPCAKSYLARVSLQGTGGKQYNAINELENSGEASDYGGIGLEVMAGPTVSNKLSVVTAGTNVGVQATSQLVCTGNPSDNDTITLDDGTNTAVVFTFQTTPGSHTTTNRKVKIGNQTWKTVAYLVEAINEAPALLFKAAHNDPATPDAKANLAFKTYGTAGNLEAHGNWFAESSTNFADPVNLTGGATNSQQRHFRRWTVESNGTFAADSSFASNGIDLGDDNWAIAAAGAQRIRIAQDKDSNYYLPWTRAGGTGDYPNTTDLITTDVDGANIKEFVFDNYDASVALSCAVPDYDLPDYSNSDAAPTTHTYALVGVSDGASDNSVYRAELTTVTQDVLSPRDMHVLAVADTSFKRVLAGSFASPTTASGTAAVDGSAPYVQMVSAFSKIYVTDGRSYFQYDPSEGNNGTISDWSCTSYGRIPQRCRLLETWRGRMVLGRDPDDPSAWHMSRVFDPNDWDNFPQNPSSADAISARNSKAGGVPGVINTIIPYTDDLLIFGCDSSIWQLTGDPRAGGQLDLVTDAGGIAFGRPWCKDPTGRLWFFGAEGGLYVMSPSTGMTNVSVGRVGRGLQEIDLAANYVQLVWNYLDEGVHIFVIPFAEQGAAGYGTIKDHWFYDARNNAFHRDRFGSATGDHIQPTAAIAVNGDLFNDRVIMLGGEDGRVRRWGRDDSGNIPVDDEQTSATAVKAIDSYVTAGPLVPVQASYAAQMSEFTAVLGETQDGANYEFFASDNAESMGAAKASGSLHAGRNKAKLIRVAGDNVFIRMRNASTSQRWAYESGSINMASGGPKR